MQTQPNNRYGQDKPMALSHNHAPTNSVEDFASNHENPSGTTAHLREWLRSHLKDMHALLDNLSNSAWSYLRTKWGPSWLVNLVNDDDFTKSPAHDDVIDDHVLSSSTWWFWSREGPPYEYERERNTMYVSKRVSDRSSRLRNPRSQRTRELCLLNRLRVHLNDRALIALGNREEVWSATVDGVPKLAGSYEIQSQRWARTLPRGPSKYSTQLSAPRTTSVSSRKRGVMHW